MKKNNLNMWVIIVDRNLEEKRENRISDILNEKNNENYLSFSYSRYNTTSSTHYAKIYKTKSGAERVIKKIKSEYDKISKPSSKFYWVKNYQFSIRKLTKEEWQSVMITKINNLDNSYKIKREKLIKEKDNYLT